MLQNSIHNLLKQNNGLVRFLKNVRNRYFLKIGIDFFILLLCAPLAVMIRRGPIDHYDVQLTLVYVAVAFAPKLLGLRIFNVHRQSWHTASIPDLLKIGYAVALSSVLIFGLVTFLRPQVVVPYGVVVIDAMLSFGLLSVFRLSARLGAEKLITAYNAQSVANKKRVLIIGAGDAGTMMAREMLRHPENGLNPVAFLDDNKNKHKQRFMDIPVLGSIEDLDHVAKKVKADLVLTAIPSVPEAIRRVVEITSKLKVRHQILPRLSDLLNGKVSIGQMRDVDVQDLLQRKPVNLNMSEISKYISGSVVLVTGAGGSIGSEIVRQVCRFKPSKLLIVGRGENSVYNLQQELHRYHSSISYIPFIADIRDEITLERIFSEHKPEIIFHAAAHKHVPLMEQNPEQAVLNNILGTANLAELALRYKAARFVNISTDKAVNPTSVMGASKRVAEYVIESVAQKAKNGQVFVSVRFGNVLGSRGSVIPLFKKQIQNGGPITVTSAEMTRYFMTIPEASQLVLQAGGMDNNGAVYVLDMGEPVKIVDLAKDLITLSGLTAEKDIKIEFTGMRPGEKLFEELLTAEEGTVSSKYEKIFMARKSKLSIDNLEMILAHLKNAAERGDQDSIRQCFHEIIPNFTGYTVNQVKTPAQ